MESTLPQPLNALELRREHLEELLRSESFERSAKLSRLLRRLVEPTLAGASQPIKEQILGIEVFERPTDWDPQTDSIVRVHVNRLRLTLRSYYADQNPPPPVRFEIPKGSYTARCVLTSVGDSASSHVRSTIASKQERFSDRAPLPQCAGPGLHEIRLQRLTYERGDLTNAAFSPDGESVVYSARWQGEPVSIYSQRIGQKYSRPLGLPSGKLRDVSATGQLLFTMGEGSIGTLAQAGLSGGPWREIVGSVSDAVWLPDNKSIAAARLEDGSMRVELPLGNPIHHFASNQTDIRLSVDPSGQRVAFVDSSLARLDFCTADVSRAVQRISKGWRVAGGIIWLSSDRLLISGARRGVAAVYSLDLQGTEESIYPTPTTWNLYDRSRDGRVLASCVDSRLHVAFRTLSMQSEERMSSLVNTRLVGLTPDAKFAVLMDLLGDGVARNSPILLTALPTGHPVQVAEGCYPQLAPDGHAVLCLERTQSETILVVTPIPSGLPRRFPLESGRRYHSAEFGDTTDRFIVHLINDDGSLQSHVLGAQSGRLTPIPGTRYITQVAPNGSWGVVPGGSELRISHLETGEIRSICSLRAGWSPVRWSTHGTEIFVFEPSDDCATGNVSRINIQTGEQNSWFSLRPADSVGAYLLRWLDVTPDGRSYAYTYQQDLSDLYILDGLT
jgi:eukaryotic-like serine/threonine-protein kinase